MNGHCVTKNQGNEIYQFHLWVKGVSPMIWRRLLLRGDNTLADFHYCIQIAFGWSNYHLNQFVIYGKPYGVYHDGGIDFDDNPRHVYLRDFQFRLNEKFIYEYNFYDHWEHEIRLEQRLPIDSKKKYPCCIGGKCAAPIDDCGGPNAFMALCDYYSPWRIEEKILKILQRYQKGKIEISDVREAFQTLKYWVSRHRLDRRAVNERLRRYASGEDVDELIWEGSCDEN